MRRICLGALAALTLVAASCSDRGRDGGGGPWSVVTRALTATESGLFGTWVNVDGDELRALHFEEVNPFHWDTASRGPIYSIFSYGPGELPRVVQRGYYAANEDAWRQALTFPQAGDFQNAIYARSATELTIESKTHPSGRRTYARSDRCALQPDAAGWVRGRVDVPGAIDFATSDTSGPTAMAVGEDRIVGFYTADGDEDLYMFQRSGCGLEAVTADAPASDVSVVVDSQGRGHALYTDQRAQIVVASHEDEGGTWRWENVAFGRTGELAIGRNDTLHAVWCSEQEGTLLPNGVAYATKAPEADRWSAPEAVGMPCSPNEPIRLWLDADDVPYAAAQSRFAVWDGAAWTVDAPGFEHEGRSCWDIHDGVVDAAGDLHVLCRAQHTGGEPAWEMQHHRLQGTSWELVRAFRGRVGALAEGPDGVYLSYVDADTTWLVAPDGAVEAAFPSTAFATYLYQDHVDDGLRPVLVVEQSGTVHLAAGGQYALKEVTP